MDTDTVGLDGSVTTSPRDDTVIVVPRLLRAMCFAAFFVMREMVDPLSSRALTSRDLPVGPVISTWLVGKNLPLCSTSVEELARLVLPETWLEVETLLSGCTMVLCCPLHTLHLYSDRQSDGVCPGFKQFWHRLCAPSSGPRSFAQTWNKQKHNGNCGTTYIHICRLRRLLPWSSFDDFLSVVQRWKESWLAQMVEVKVLFWQIG